ncbi:uncharacterized protein LY79DRAFT_342291 [Colletotrichum navitas]|uniref:Uncharacterized protein n=1 Tax=Colletotrichum navitas TaxID=681940 RepID=A0AAD8PRQ5_9PEZI|nr:uncharacterized protein LY79DRAFT_342291 [Colletotrichum navitas]KAK1579431.1 hypothetical protein LY79DRAFT_342291 [Colletotrichum navitas]
MKVSCGRECSRRERGHTAKDLIEVDEQMTSNLAWRREMSKTDEKDGREGGKERKKRNNRRRRELGLMLGQRGNFNGFWFYSWWIRGGRWDENSGFSEGRGLGWASVLLSGASKGREQRQQMDMYSTLCWGRPDKSVEVTTWEQRQPEMWEEEEKGGGGV